MHKVINEVFHIVMFFTKRMLEGNKAGVLVEKEYKIGVKRR